VRHKKGSFFFILDVFIASFIFLVTLFMIISFKVSIPEYDALSTKLTGFTNIVFKNPVNSYSNEYKDILKENPQTWPDPLITTDELVYYLWANGHNESATLLVQSISEMLLPNHIGIRYKVDDIIVYEQKQFKEEYSKIAISNAKITYKLINTTYSLGPVTTEVILWQ
jgi:hypothetical protein